MKSAKEMFERLGYEIDEQSENEILYKMKCESEIYWVSFVLERESFECFITSDLPIETYHSYEISINLLQAINKQVEELHWNDITVNIDVKLDGKKVMEAMRGGNNA